MTKQDLAATSARLMDDIAENPADWRAFEDRLRQVISVHQEMGQKLPAQLGVYASWLEQDDFEASLENMPV